MVVFKNAKTAERAAILRDHGMSKTKRYWHEEVGFNYRLTNLQAAIGVAQLEKVDFIVNKKLWLASLYQKHLSGITQIQLPMKPKGNNSINSYWLYTIILRPEYINKRQKLLDYLENHGIESRPVFLPMHRMPPYQQYRLSNQNYNCANQISDGGVSLPSSVSITENEIMRVCSTLRAALLIE